MSRELVGEQVLVTGAGGFIGSHLTERLVRLGADVRAFCPYNSLGSKGWLDETAPEITANLDVRFGDVRDFDTVLAASEGCTFVFHLAALIAIPYSYAAYRSFVDTNVTGTLNVLEATRRSGVGRMLHTSTSEVYGTPDTLPITEAHALKGQSPYSASKIGADKLCEAWACSFGTPVVVLRPFNTFGPRQSLRAVIPTVLAQMLSGADEVHLGSRTTRRDFTYVSDTVEAFVKAAEADLEPGEVVQLGTGQSVSVEDVVRLGSEVLGIEVRVVSDADRLRPPRSEIAELLSNPTRASDRLGWKALVSMREGVERTVEWLRPRVRDLDAGTYHT